jgi:hypothetical protein
MSQACAVCLPVSLGIERNRDTSTVGVEGRSIEFVDWLFRFACKRFCHVETQIRRMLRKINSSELANG